MKMNKNERFEKLAAGTVVVLVGSRRAGNIGASARAMANFGFSRLRLVDPQAAHLGKDALAMAVDAGPVLRSAEVFATLQEAVADCQHVFATTRRTGKHRRAELAPSDMGRMLATIDPARGAAIVFGPEDKGLDAESLLLCNGIVTLQTQSEYNSLNLAQAVLLMLYEVHRAFLGEAATGASLAGRVDALTSSAEELLREAGFITGTDSAQVAVRLRKLAMRARPTDSETKLLHAAMLLLKENLKEEKISAKTLRRKSEKKEKE
jgi:tRNA/rRNA methyltransferase